MQIALERWRRGGSATVDEAILRHIGPVHFARVNFRGLFHFPVRRYAHRLLEGSGRSMTKREKRRR